MEIRSASIDLNREATGVSVVIDVLRAFTTAAYALTGELRTSCSPQRSTKRSP
jgi:phosphosulfolactate phosphohydrolase-like enzyme